MKRLIGCQWLTDWCTEFVIHSNSHWCKANPLYQPTNHPTTHSSNQSIQNTCSVGALAGTGAHDVIFAHLYYVTYQCTSLPVTSLIFAIFNKATWGSCLCYCSYFSHNLSRNDMTVRQCGRELYLDISSFVLSTFYSHSDGITSSKNSPSEDVPERLRGSLGVHFLGRSGTSLGQRRG